MKVMELMKEYGLETEVHLLDATTDEDSSMWEGVVNDLCLCEWVGCELKSYDYVRSENTVYAFAYMKWYAVLQDDEDDDYGYGSFDLEEAKAMAERMGDEAYIVLTYVNDDAWLKTIRRDEDGEWSE